MCSFLVVCVCVLQASEAFRRGEFNVSFFFFLHEHAPLYIHEGIFYTEGFCLDGGLWAGHNKILNIITINGLGWWGIMRTRLNQNELPTSRTNERVYSHFSLVYHLYRVSGLIPPGNGRSEPVPAPF